MIDEPTLEQMMEAVNRAIANGHQRTAKLALIAAGWVRVAGRSEAGPFHDDWLRAKPEMPGDREFVINKCRGAGKQ